MKNKWSETEIEFLKNNYTINGCEYCANYLNKSTGAIYIKVSRLELIVEEKWSNEDDYFLINNYNKLGIKKCSLILKRSNSSIKARTNKLNLKLINNIELIIKFNKKHYDKFDYSLVNYIDSKTKIKIICPLHGEFEQLPYEHLRGKACPICNESKGEKEIRFILENKRIKFIHQYKFNDCKNINKLPFDFYLPEHNICIEYHGEQHYKPIKWFGGEEVFKKLRYRDNIKMEYCHCNNIPLIIIKYTDSIEETLKLLL